MRVDLIEPDERASSTVATSQPAFATLALSPWRIRGKTRFRLEML
jgi:hypothetical protein